MLSIMKIYIAARTSQRDEVKRYNAQFAKMGIIVLDWTTNKNTKPYLDHPDLVKRYSISDLNHVRECDIFVMLLNEVPGTGQTTELGAAILANSFRKKKKIYIVGEYLDKNMFYFHPSVIHKKTVEEVVQEIGLLL
jgi:hypothetical protein